MRHEAEKQAEKQTAVVQLQDRALDNLSYIRRTMESAGSFTAVPGWGGVLIGITALVAASVASFQGSPQAWLTTWLVAAAIALLIGGWAIDRKLHAIGQTITSGPARRFIMSFIPPLLVGGMLTFFFVQHQLFDPLAGTWLLLYGAAVAAAGAFSVREMPIMGSTFLALGALALILPLPADLMLALGFGGLHLLFGLIIARKYDG